jgi:hypothetical protein
MIDRPTGGCNGHPQTSIPKKDKMNRTWFPILCGVLGGLLTCLIFVMLDQNRPPFYQFTGWLLNETHPTSFCYYWVFRGIMLMFIGIGGALGIHFSRWPFGKCVLFLSAILVLVGFLDYINFN